MIQCVRYTLSLHLSMKAMEIIKRTIELTLFGHLDH